MLISISIREREITVHEDYTARNEWNYLPSKRSIPAAIKQRQIYQHELNSTLQLFNQIQNAIKIFTSK
jgi:hypothetical protein